MTLEADPHPSMAFVVFLVIEGGNCIGEGKEVGFGTSVFRQPLLEQLVFVGHHLNKSLARYVAARVTVNSVAELHVVGRNGLGYRTGGSSGLKKMAGYFLTCTYFGKSTVLRCIEVDA
tara:strand:- start:1316 stop:1669 length:354 start_codon:yes stop_codon:yes gene_type:complete